MAFSDVTTSFAVFSPVGHAVELQATDDSPLVALDDNVSPAPTLSSSTDLAEHNRHLMGNVK
jgi:hypothetical protein